MSIKIRSTLPSIAFGLLTVAVATSASASPSDRLAERLGLTEAQESSLTSLREEYAPSRDSAQAQREEIIAMVKAGNVDAAAELASSQARERVYQRAEMQRRMSEILTPDQMSEMETIRSSRSNRHIKGRRRGE